MADTMTDNSALLGKYEKFSEAENLAESIGRLGAARKARKKTTKLLEKNPGLDVSGVDVQDFGNWEDYGPGSADLAMSGLRTLRRPWANRAKDPARAMNRYGINLNTALEGKMKTGLMDEVMPSVDAAQARADELAGTAAISASEEQAMRSRMVSMVRKMESERLARLGSALGYGNATSSPAAAALAADASDDADRSIVSSLRDLGLQVSEMNRQQARLDTDLATRIASTRFAIQNGDSKSLIGMRGDIAQMLDALYSRDATLELQRKELKEASERTTMDRVKDWSSVISNLTRGAASAASGFGGMGGA